MWYVNMRGRKYNNNRPDRFILTMWYVNFFLWITLWINCGSFILTKWYVNLIKLYTRGLIYLSFILTKWYVN